MKQSPAKQSEIQRRLTWLNKYYLKNYGGWKLPAGLLTFWVAYGFYRSGLSFALSLLGLVAVVMGIILLMPNVWFNRYTAWVNRGTKASPAKLLLLAVALVVGSMTVLVGGIYLWQRMHPRHHEVCVQNTSHYSTCSQW